MHRQLANCPGAAGSPHGQSVQKLQINLRATSQTLQASVSMLNVKGKVHDSTIREKLDRHGLCGSVAE